MLSRTLPPHGPGGLGAAALDLAAALGRAGARVRLLTTGGGRPETRLPGVHIHALPCPAGRYSAAWWRGSLAAYDRWAHEVDAILSVSAAANAIVARRSTPPAVFQAHGVSAGEIASKLRAGTPRALAGVPRQLYWGVVRDRAYRDYDAVVAVGEAVRRRLQAWPTSRLVGSTPMRLIHNGLAPGAFRFDPEARTRVRRRLGVADETRLALFAGRLQPDKGPRQALEAVRLARAAGADVRLAMVGDGPESPALQAAASRDPLLRDAVSFLGPQPREAIAAWLSAADALLFPTRRSEGLPLMVLEALASGCTVLTTAAGAADPELLCVRLDPFDVEGFAAALVQPRVEASREDRLPPAFRLDAAAQAYLDLFETLAANRSRLAA